MADQKLSLQQKLLQKLSPQQIQVIKLLEIPTMQLEQRIKSELEENPILELIENDDTNESYDDTERWAKIWRIQTDGQKTADEYEVIFRSLLEAAQIDYHAIPKVILSSVVPRLIRPFREMLARIPGAQVLVVGPEIYSRLPVKVLNPYEVGTDIVADATAAFTQYGGPVMVIDFGTALTFTTVAVNGEILGVAIAPGLQTALRSLTGNTAQLHDVPLESPPSVLGTNTVHAIQSGIVLGFAGLVDSMVSRTEEEMGKKLKVIATGGLSHVLKDVAKKIEVIDENLTLNGLRYMAFHI